MISSKKELLDSIESIIDKNYATFMGSNEAELHAREDIVELFEEKARYEAILFARWILNNASTAMDEEGCFCWERANEWLSSPDLYSDYIEETTET
jgi:hypothetical protein